MLAATNPARYHGFEHLGSLGPGHQADILGFDHLATWEPAAVWQAGRAAVRRRHGRRRARVRGRGIDYIPLADRRGRPIDLAWMWAGALFNVEYVVYGALIMSFGLRFWQAAVVIAVGNLSYLIAGLGSLQGPRPAPRRSRSTARRSDPTAPS